MWNEQATRCSCMTTAPETMPMLNDGRLLEAFTRISKIGLFAGVHSENEGIVKYRDRAAQKGRQNAPRPTPNPEPEVSETEAVARAASWHARPTAVCTFSM